MDKTGIVLLTDLLPDGYYIFGDNRGNLGLISAELVEDNLVSKLLFEHAPQVVRTVAALKELPDTTASQWARLEVEDVELRKAIVGSKWMIRCAYQEQIDTWVVLDMPPVYVGRKRG